MTRCPNCNAELKEGAHFCHVCGYKILDPKSAEDTQKVKSEPPEEKINAKTFSDVKSEEVFANVKSGNLFRRIFAILFSPNKEWGKISKEKPKVGLMVFGYLLILSIVAISASFIGELLKSWRFHNYYTASFLTLIVFYSVKFVTLMLTPVIAAWILDLLAGNFKIQKNFGKMLQLTAYSFTPVYIAWTLFLIPIGPLFHLVQIVGLYGALIFLLGYKKVFEVPAQQQVKFYFVGIGILYGVYYVLYWTVHFIQTPFYGAGYFNLFPY